MLVAWCKSVSGSGFTLVGGGIQFGKTAEESGEAGIDDTGSGSPTGVRPTHEGECLCDRVERIRHCARSDSVATGRKPAVANSESEDLEPRDWIGASGQVGVQLVLLTEAGPELGIGCCHGASTGGNCR